MQIPGPPWLKQARGVMCAGMHWLKQARGVMCDRPNEHCVEKEPVYNSRLSGFKQPCHQKIFLAIKT